MVFQSIKLTSPTIRLIGCVLLLFVLSGCVSPLDSRAFDDWQKVDRSLYRKDHRSALQRAAQPEQTRSTPVLSENASLDEFIHYAMQNNPALEAAYYRWRAAVERIPQARSLPDPQVSFGIVLDQVDKDAQFMGERYGLMQMFPWFGTLELRGEAASEAAFAAAQRFEAERLMVVDRVTAAYFEHAYLQQAVFIAREHRDLLKSIEAISRSRFRAGSTGQADITRLEIEVTRLDEQMRSLQDMLTTTQSALNAALGRAADMPIKPPLKPSEHSLPDLPDHSPQEWALLIDHQNPTLAAARFEAARERQNISLARRESYPDLTLGIEYGRGASRRMSKMDGGGEDMIVGTVSINLPIWEEKNSARVREALAQFGAATQTIREQQLTLHAEFVRALFAYRDSERKIDLYGKSLLPKARQSLHTTEADYRAGDGSFSDLVDAQRVLLEFALAHERAAADRAQALARIHSLVGHTPAPVSTIPPAQNDPEATPPAPTSTSEDNQP